MDDSSDKEPPKQKEPIKPTENELSFRKNKYDDLTDVVEDGIHCTVCSADLKHAVTEGETLHIHPRLEVLLCKACKSELEEVCFDDDGSDMLCRLCGKGDKEFYWCDKSTCPSVFCRECLQKNLDENHLKLVTKDYWECLVCDPKPIYSQRAVCEAAILFVQQKKLEKIQKGKAGVVGHEEKNDDALPWANRVRTREARKNCSYDETQEHSEQDFRCRVCKARFKKRDQLKKHERLHERGTALLACATCGRQFSRPSDLRKHARNTGHSMEPLRVATPPQGAALQQHTVLKKIPHSSKMPFNVKPQKGNLSDNGCDAVLPQGHPNTKVSQRDSEPKPSNVQQQYEVLEGLADDIGCIGQKLVDQSDELKNKFFSGKDCPQVLIWQNLLRLGVGSIKSLSAFMEDLTKLGDTSETPKEAEKKSDGDNTVTLQDCYGQSEEEDVLSENGSEQDDEMNVPATSPNHCSSKHSDPPSGKEWRQNRLLDMNTDDDKRRWDKKKSKQGSDERKRVGQSKSETRCQQIDSAPSDDFIRRKRKRQSNKSSSLSSSESHSKKTEKTKKRKRIQVIKSSSSDDESSASEKEDSPKKGRKMIRRVMKEENLGENTKLAAREEEEQGCKRIEERNKKRYDSSVRTPTKIEYVISVRLTEIQETLYKHFLDNYSSSVIQGKEAQFSNDFQNFQQIWTHPRVLKMSAERNETKAEKLQQDEDSEKSLRDFIDDGDKTSTDGTSSQSSSSNNDVQCLEDDNAIPKQRTSRRLRSNKDQEDPEPIALPDETRRKEWWQAFVKNEDFEDLEASSKLVLLFSILKECEKVGDKLLVFSQSLLSLDLIEYFLEKIDDANQNGSQDESLIKIKGSWAKGIDFFRLDELTPTDHRSKWCKDFNNEENLRADSLEINLVAANRAIIFDESWNPSHDVQSIFREYWSGQKKQCFIYHFLAQGTMEEKIYERQVTKLSLACRVVDKQQLERQYNMADLLELYSFTPADRNAHVKPKLPKDGLFAAILKAHEDLITSYYEHDSENKKDEELNEEERQAACEEYENEKKGKLDSLLPTAGPD